MGQWYDCPVICRQWVAHLALGHFELFSRELLWKYNSIFLHNFLQNFLSKLFWIIIFYYLLFFYNLKNIKLDSLLTVWCALRPSQQPTVPPNYSQSIKINIVSSEGGMIIPLSHRPTISYWRLTELKFVEGLRCLSTNWICQNAPIKRLNQWFNFLTKDGPQITF